MDDLDVLARDFGFGPRGKSNPMRSSSSQPDRRSPRSKSNYNNSNNYDNSVGGGSRYASMDGFGFDAIFNSTKKTDNASGGGSNSKASSFPAYDKPVYDDERGDMFEGLPGVKSESAVRFENDVFASKSRHGDSGFDDLLGNLGRSERGGESNKNRSARSGTIAKGFDDLVAGFGSGGSASSNNRRIPERNTGTVPYGGSKHESILDDPFVDLGSSAAHASFSSRVYSDPLEEIGKIGKTRSARAEVSSGGGGMFDDLDPLNSFGKPVDAFSSGRERKGQDGSPSRSTTPQSSTNRELNENSSFRNSESNMQKRNSIDKFKEPPLFDAPNISTDFQKSFGQNASSPEFYETGSQVDMSATTEQEQHYDDIWLSVSEIPLFTRPTAAPPPSRPPPPKPRQASRSGVGSFSSGSRKKGDEFSSPKSYSQYSQNSMPFRSAAKGPPVTQLDELEDFAQSGPQHIFHESANLHSSEDTNEFSASAASAAAMKEAMDTAEAKFRHAKEVREREYAKASRNKEPDGQGTEFWETERKHKEEEEREQRRLEREREKSREIEREKGRQAVERATREARERAVAGARERATAEARVKAERAAVGKANAEARARAERVAVQRAQAEARERAAAEAKDRAERAAAAAESRDKAAVERAEAESRRRSERAAVERAAAEARERAAAEARERASTAAKVNQPRTEDDLESFFSMGRASSAPRPRSNPADPFFDQQFQNKGGFQGAQKTSASGGPPPNMKKASSTSNIVDDLSSIFGAAPSSGEFQEVEGETEERRRARLHRHQRTQERAVQALAEMNQRDLQALREQEERHRISETLDFEIKRWASGKEGNLRALLSTLQYVLWPECGWQPVSLTDLIAGASVKKVYRKATLCIHPDKVQQKGATLQQKYIAEKVFDLLKEAWNKFNAEELF